ncbi:translation initiation factor IF-2-like [Phacochoerus africanus]|uniref:translation initiation factor IF-2-like n=1 Tax=Phacochoerus africanus TaxID=41426 RepID=UPI001FD9437F|nr:translation initiation factor IF-2-like [Phacochoerus africanus]
MRSAAKGAGRTGHAAPSPDPARAGGRGRPRGGPAGGRPAGSSPRRPASIKPRARPRAQAPAEAAAPGPHSRWAPGSPRARETPNPEAGRDLGAAAPHTHPGSGAGPRERPPGMKRFPVPSRFGKAGSRVSPSTPHGSCRKSSNPTPSDWKYLSCRPTVFGVTSLSPSQFRPLPMEANAFPASFSPPTQASRSLKSSSAFAPGSWEPSHPPP